MPYSYETAPVEYALRIAATLSGGSISKSLIYTKRLHIFLPKYSMCKQRIKTPVIQIMSQNCFNIFLRLSQRKRGKNFKNRARACESGIQSDALGAGIFKCFFFKGIFLLYACFTSLRGKAHGLKWQSPRQRLYSCHTERGFCTCPRSISFRHCEAPTGLWQSPRQRYNIIFIPILLSLARFELPAKYLYTSLRSS